MAGLLGFGGSALAQTAIPASERTVLLTLFNQTGGPNWTNNSGWGGAVGSECAWFGVVCSANGGNVDTVNLSGNGLTGTLPAIIGLTQLRILSIERNKLTGSLPSLSGLKQLTAVFASVNQFSGSIPSLSGLSNLQFFYAENNQLSGSIPALTGLPNLQIFNVASNQLAGTLPSLSGLSSLQVFAASSNRLTGSIPPLVGLNNLALVSVYGNQLTGGLPDLRGLPNLTYFAVWGNRLTGSIPPLSGANVHDFEVSGNQLTGTIPTLNGNLEVLVVDNNQLVGNLPPFSAAPILRYFSAAKNQLSGSIPSLAGVGNTLQALVLDNNQLTGAAPQLTGLPNLVSFTVSNNRLSGSLPSLTGLTKLQNFSVGGNGFSGDVPASPASLLANGSSLCNNALNKVANTAWDTAVGASPWYSGCTSVPATLRLATTDSSVATGTLTTITATVSASSLGASPTITGNPPTGSVTITDDSGKVICYIAIVNGSGTCNVQLRSGSTTNLNGGYSGNVNVAPASATIPKTTPVAVSGNLDQHGWTGIWYNPATSGQGIVFEIYPDVISVGTGLIGGGWFTFDTSTGGEDKKRWYTLTGQVSSSNTTTTLDVISPTGGNFNTAPIINSGNGQTWVGHATLNFTDCATGNLSYSFTDGSSRVGNIPLKRLDSNVTCDPTNSAGNGTAPGKFLLSGAWYTPSTSGQGLLFDINPVQNLTAAAWYTFAPNGQSVGGGASQRWYTLQIPSANVGTATLDNIGIYSAQGGVFDAPGGVTTPQVGTASIAFNNCNSMVLNYNFTAGTNTGLSGTINLQRVGPTPAGCSL